MISSAWRKTDAPAVPKSDDGCWVHTLQCVFEELEALGLSGPAPKKRVRKPNLEDPDPKPKRPREQQKRMQTILSEVHSPTD